MSGANVAAGGMTRQRHGPANPVLASLAVAAGLAGALGGFVTEAPNRLVTGAPLGLWQAAGPAPSLAIGASILLLLATALNRRAGPRTQWTALAAGAALLLISLYGAGHAAHILLDAARPAARTSLGAAFWIIALCAALAMIDAVQRLDVHPIARLAIAAGIVGAVAFIAEAGLLDALSIAREYAARQTVFAAALVRHCALVLASLCITAAVGMPLGLLAARRPRAKALLFTGLNILQTIPSIALFGLLIAPLSALAAWSPTLAALGVQGIGAAPALIALCLYALLPVVRNTAAAIAAADPGIVDAARGMGFTSWQVLWRVELPLGLPLLLAGLRIVLVQTIGLAVVAALIGAGGLGIFVFQGIGQYAVDLVLLGALPAIALALAADFLMRQAIAMLRRRIAP